MKSITSNKISENDQIIIYQTSDGKTQIDVRMENETVWLNAKQMALLFERDSKTHRQCNKGRTDRRCGCRKICDNHSTRCN